LPVKNQRVLRQVYGELERGNQRYGDCGNLEQGRDQVL
jgi:hypothetical protein